MINPQVQDTPSWQEEVTEERQQRQRLLNFMLIGVTISALLLLSLTLFLYPLIAPVPSDIAYLNIALVVVLLSAGITYIVARRISLDLAIAGFLCSLVVVGALSDVPMEVVGGRSLIIFVIPIFAAGILLSPGASFVFAGLSSAAVSIISLAVLRQLPNIPSILVFFFVALIVWFFARNLRDNTRKLHHTLHDLRQREADFRLLFADNPLPMCLARVSDARLIEVNDAAISHYGYSRSELLDFCVTDILVAPPDLPPDAYQMPTTWPYRGEQLHRLRDGSIHTMAVTAHRVSITGGDAILVIAEDITERKRVEAQLRLMSRVAHESPTSIVIMDRNGVVEFVNHTFEAMSGRSGKDLIGKTWQMLPFPGAMDDVFRQVDSKLLHGEVWRAEFPTPGKMGATVWIALSISALHDDYGAISHLLSVAEDITARHDAEEMLQRLNAELEDRVAQRTAELAHANRNLARSARLKDEFLATMSHELRTPLTGILGGADALLLEVYGTLNARQVHTLRLIEHCGRELLAIINDILDLSSIEAGALTLERHRVDAADLCAASLSLLSEQITTMAHTVAYTCTPSNLTFEADPKRMKQILVNLLDNAIKFTPKGGTINLDVQLDAAAQLLHFTVSDTGIGIDAETLPRLFQPFVQADSGLNRAYGGAGLGLALVRRLTELHGGSIGVESTQGRGSRFWVTLPWTATDGATGTVIEPATPVSSTVSPVDVSLQGILPHRPLLLLAEDNPSSSELIVDWLERAGVAVNVVARGDEVLSAVVAHRPDLVLLDIQLPNLDGVQVAQLVRAHADPGVAHTPILAVTALVMPGDRERCLAAGANDYLSKPFAVHTLMTKIREMLLDHATVHQAERFEFS